MAFRMLVLCTGNSARSQIAEALLATRGAGRVEVVSAGSHPAARVNPFAIDVLRAHGIEWEGREPRGLDGISADHFDLVITVCDNARDACPFLPGAAAQVHWGLSDPAEEHEPDAARRAFAGTYAALSRRIDRLLALPLESLAPSELQRQAADIHRST
jgi:arsenate reductase (thioredoxin)